MAKKVTIQDAEDRGLMNPEEAENLEAEYKAEAEGEALPVEEPPAPQPQPEPQPEPAPESQEAQEEHPSRANERIRQLVAERKEAQARADQNAKEAQELRERWARLDERKQLAEDAAKRFEQEREEQARQAQRPDPAIDPQAAEIWDLREARRQDAERLAAIEQRLTQSTEQTAQNFEQQQMLNYLRDDVGRFERQKPDYQDAARYAAEKRKEFWMNVGYPEANAAAIVQNETAAIVRAGQLNNRSVAETVYGLATQWGYQPNGNGSAQPAQTNGTGITNQEKLRQIAAGQAVQGMPRTAGGEGLPNDIAKMSLKQIAELPEDYFMEQLKTPEGARQMNQMFRRERGE